LIGAGGLGLPLVDRLFTAIDPSLRSLHEQRSPFLFPSLWPAESFPPLIVQASTLAIAAHFQHGRTILAAIILIGLSGIAITAIFGDWLSSLLIVQAQPWRMAWLMAAAEVMALGVSHLSNRGGEEAKPGAWSWHSWCFAGRSTPNSRSLVRPPAAILALLLHFRAKRFAPAIKPPAILSTWIFTIVAAAIWKFRLLAYPWHFSMEAPAGHGNFELLIVTGYLAFPLCALAVYFALAKPRISPFLHGGFAVLLLLAGFSLWDHRSPAQRMMEENRLPPELMRLIDQRQGEVFWMNGLAEPWFDLGRPQWASPLPRRPDHLFARPCRRMAAPDANPDGFGARGSKKLRAPGRPRERRCATIIARWGAAALRARRCAGLSHRAA